MSVTLRQVAEEAGVSRATASRILNKADAHLFALATRQRVEDAARRLQYHPNHVARALITGTTQLVTLWTYHPYQAFYGAVIVEVQRQARQCGYGLIVADVAVREPEEEGPKWSPWPSDGILAMDCGHWAEEVLRARPKSTTPLVSMGTALIPGTDSVRLDLATAFTAAAEHLVEQGCRRIAYFTRVMRDQHPVSAPVFGAPLDAYREVLRKAKLKPEVIQLTTATRDLARSAIVQHVRDHGCPDAVLCRNDDLAIGTYRAMCDLGIEVGRDVLLVGCDGIEDTQYLHCPLSTIVPPVPRMCELAWEFWEKRKADPAAPLQEAVLEARLEVRQSSATKR